MVIRLAVTLALLAFATCLLVGGLEADNGFAVTVLRALQAMVATLVIGLIVGSMGRRMLQENIAAGKENLKNDSGRVGGGDR